MPRTYIPLSSKAAAQIDIHMKRSTSVWEYRRLQCVSLRQFGMQARDVAKIVKLHRDSVLHIWAAFQQGGVDAILGEKRGRVRSAARWTREEERAFIDPFLKAAERGKLTTVREVYKAQCQQTGKTRSHGDVPPPRSAWVAKDRTEIAAPESRQGSTEDLQGLFSPESSPRGESRRSSLGAVSG
jgi:transposase